MPKKNSTKKPSVKVKDLRARKSPKGGGKAAIKDLSFTHVVDKASPILATTSTSANLKFSSADALKIK